MRRGFVRSLWPFLLHRRRRSEPTRFAMPRECLGRLQISCLLTQQMSWLQTQQMSCLQTQHMSCLQTIQVSCGQDRFLVEGSESCNPSLRIFAGKMRKMCFSPHGSVWSFEGWVLLRISLGLAVRTCWSDLEKFPKSASGKILGQHFGSGTFLGRTMVPKKVVLWRNDFVVGF